MATLSYVQVRQQGLFPNITLKSAYLYGTRCRIVGVCTGVIAEVVIWDFNPKQCCKL